MPKTTSETIQHKNAVITAMNAEFQTWQTTFQDLARYILPRRYNWLNTTSMSPVGLVTNTKTSRDFRNKYILDGTGTKAARDLAAGMMNGITSPSRPWFRLRVPGLDLEDTDILSQRYLQESRDRMLLVMAESNFYNAMAMLYVDLPVFGTAGTIVYEDFDEVIRCYNTACGEYRIAQDDRKVVNTFSRTFSLTVRQLVGQFGEENLSASVLADWKRGGAAHYNQVSINHLVEPNLDDNLFISGGYDFRELYWERGNTDGTLLELSGYHEMPAIFPRWELIGNDTYGSGPALDALADIIQLQHETKRKGQILDLMTRPPLVADIQLKSRPNALFPGGITYLSSVSQVGVKPAYEINNPPIQEISQDLFEIRARIKETFHNDLFRMISNLDTVRSATEIDARREEKLIMLGPVLERFENEALDPLIKRIYNIMSRKDLLPDPPPNLENVELEVEYVSVLSDAQRAVGTIPMERFLELIGNLAPVVPEVLQVPDFSELLREYAARLNVPAIGIKTRDQARADQQQAQDLQTAQQEALVGKDLTQAAANLSKTDVGGGRNAVQALLGS